MRISDWRSDVCSSDLVDVAVHAIRVTDDDAEVLRVATDVEFLDILAEGAGDRDFIALPATDRDGAGHVVDDQLAGGGQRSRLKLGRAACRDRLWQYVSTSVGDVSLNK